MEVKFNNDDFYFYRSGVMILERLKNGISSPVRAFTHEPFNLSCSNLSMLLLVTKLRSSSIITILTLSFKSYGPCDIERCQDTNKCIRFDVPLTASCFK